MGYIERIEITVILVLMCSFSVSAQSCNWTGVWDTDWGDMELFQSGDIVTGNYSDGEGRISGTVSDDKLVGTWSEEPSFAPPDDAGDFEIAIYGNCSFFSGYWRFGSSGEWEEFWMGMRAIAMAIPGESMFESEIFEYDRFLGIVENGKFLLLEPSLPLDETVRLTSIPMQAAQSPESGELDLTSYEGDAIMVTGYDGGGWIYSASVIDHAGPILTAVVKELFEKEDME